MTEEQLFDNIYGIIYPDVDVDSDLKHNNANKPSERLTTQRDMVAGEVSKFILEEEMPRKLVDAQKDGKIYVHDRDYRFLGLTNCCLIALEDMLKNGTKIGNAEIESPKSIQTAAALTAQIVSTVSNSQYGGTSIDRIDEVLAPYVRKSYDKHHAFAKRWTKDSSKASVMATQMVEKEVYDACQSLEYELNTMYNSHSQTPFVTFTFGLGTGWESRLIQKSLLEVRMKGLGKSGLTPIFPKLIFILKDDVNKKEGDVNYDIKQLAIKCTAKRMYPDYVSYENVCEVTGDFKGPMGCRSFLSANENGETAGRNNLGVVTVNLPEAAIEAKESGKDFMDVLEEYADLAFYAQDWCIEGLKTVKAKQAPILYMHGGFGMRLQPEELVFDHFYGRASVSIGYIGCYEMLQVLFGADVDQTKPEMVEFTKEVLTYLKDRCEYRTAETNLGYSLYATPAESLCNTLNKIGENKHPEYEWLYNKGYFTNSHHLDVRKKVAPNVKYDYESNFTKIASGGAIAFVELPDMSKFLPALEWVIDYGISKAHYIGVNIPIDSCDDCGYLGESISSENGFVCPHCGSSNIEVTRRVCGYLGAPGSRPFNSGKQHEVMQRVKHVNLN